MQLGSLGSLEGHLAEVTSTAIRLHPVMALVKGTVIIDDYSVVAALRQVTAVRGCSRAVAEEAMAEMQKVVAQAKALEAATAEPSKPSVSWGNPL